MSAATAPVETPVSTDQPELQHYFCDCDPVLALCGADLTGHHVCPDDDSCRCVPCVVCHDLAPLPCERCGG